MIGHLKGPRGREAGAKKNGVKGQDHYVKAPAEFLALNEMSASSVGLNS